MSLMAADAMRALVIPGTRQHVQRFLDLAAGGVVGILVHEDIPDTDPSVRALAARTAARVLTLATLQSVAGDALSSEGMTEYERCLLLVLADVRSHYLATRMRLDSAQNNVVLIENCVVNAVRVLLELAPSVLVCSSTPHSLPAWVLASCAETLGIPTYIMEQSPIRDRAWLLAGLDAQRPVPWPKETRPPSATDAPSDAVMAQVRPQMEGAAGARDERGVPLSRMELGSIAGASGNEWWSFSRELRLVVEAGARRLPLRVAQSVFKDRLYRAYTRRASAEVPNTPFVAFFMHYQPERTTLPEGLGFTQQLLALRLLSHGLPEGWKVLVREHPTTWLKPANPTVRRIDMYDRIAALPGVQLCAMEIDTFELIDQSVAVATLTGKVGFQAILRGKPALVFGAASYRDHPACQQVTNYAQVHEALARVARGELASALDRATLMRYLAWVEQHTVRAEYDGTDIYELRLRNFEALYRLALSGALPLAGAMRATP